MSTVPLRRIKSVEARPGYRLAIAWDRGQGSMVDLSDMISRGGVFEELSDSKKFGAVRIGENNRLVEWPAPSDELSYPLIGIDADALFEKSSHQQNDSLASSMRRMLDAVRAVGKHSAASTKT